MILAYLRFKLLGFDPVELRAQVASASARASIAIDICDTNRKAAEANIGVVQRRGNGFQDRLNNIETTLTGKATAGDITILHERLDALTPAPVAPAGLTMVNGRALDLSGDIPTVQDLPAEKTEELPLDISGYDLTMAKFEELTALVQNGQITPNQARQRAKQYADRKAKRAAKAVTK